MIKLENKYTVIFAITDPESKRFSAEYFPAVSVSRDVAFKTAEKIKRDIEQCRYFGFAYSFKEDPHAEDCPKDLFYVHKAGCKQKIVIQRQDGIQKLFYENETK